MLPSSGHRDNFLHTFTWHGFSIFTVWNGLFSLALAFPGLGIEAPPLFTVQGKCIYTLLKRRTRKFNLSGEPGNSISALMF